MRGLRDDLRLIEANPPLYAVRGVFPEGLAQDGNRVSQYVVAPEQESGDGPLSLWLFSVDSGRRRRLTQPPGRAGDINPAFSPDGRTLAFCRGGQLYLLRLDPGFEPKGVPELFPTEVRAIRCPVWTADGRELLFVGGPSYTGTDTYGDVWRIAKSGSGKASRLLERVEFLAISPRGNRLIDGEGQGDPNIWQVDLEEPDRSRGAPRPQGG